MGEEVVIFDEQEFLSIYPTFQDKFTSDELQNFFDIATGILNNTSLSPVCDVNTRKRMLYLLTAHIAFLFSRGAGAIGAVASASEGSVSASFAIPNNLSAQWFNQTQYGALFWMLAKPYMLGRYIPGC